MACNTQLSLLMNDPITRAKVICQKAMATSLGS